MIESTFTYRKDGIDYDKPNTKNDIVVSMKRVEEEKIKSWTPKQKQEAIELLEITAAAFDAFKSEIIKYCTV